MLSKLLLAFALMATCVVIHALCVTTLLKWSRQQAALATVQWRRLLLFVRLAAWIIGFHMIEIGVWAVAYRSTHALDLPSAIYFSAVTYTTTGYGDVVLPLEWRLLGGVEALTGILMCGWSTGFFFAVVSRLESPSQPRVPEVRR